MCSSIFFADNKMDSKNILFVGIVVLVTLVIIGFVINEGYCMPSGVNYSNTGGYMRNYGWPTAMPYDSFARQSMATSDLNVCAPNVLAANSLGCDSTSAMASGSQDFGSVRKTGAHEMTSAVKDMPMVQSPEVSYNYTYNTDRGSGRYGWNSKQSGMTSYGDGPSGCGFKMFSAPPLNGYGPAGSFTSRPVQTSGECSASQGYNMATGVM